LPDWRHQTAAALPDSRRLAARLSPACHLVQTSKPLPYENLEQHREQGLGAGCRGGVRGRPPLLPLPGVCAPSVGRADEGLNLWRFRRGSQSPQFPRYIGTSDSLSTRLRHESPKNVVLVQPEPTKATRTRHAHTPRCLCARHAHATEMPRLSPVLSILGDSHTTRTAIGELEADRAQAHWCLVLRLGVRQRSRAARQRFVSLTFFW
jgi:hypothetical protein